MPTSIDFDSEAAEKNAFRQFSDWVRWDDRPLLLEPIWNYKMSGYPGVYLLAHFDNPPSGAADCLDRKVIYVGEGGRLGRRWYQFERSAKLGFSGHSGGFSYRDKYGTRMWKKLFLAAFPIWFGQKDESMEDWTQIYRLYVERRILWEITMHRAGQHGLLNSK